jgi:neopullulanase
MLYFALNTLTHMRNILSKGIKTMLLFCFIFVLKANSQSITRVEPSFWYTGFKQKNLQILMYGPNIVASKISMKPYAGVVLKKINKVENPNYVFLDLELASQVKAGNIRFSILNKGKNEEFKYEIRNRSAYKTPGVNASDFIYLLIPDRFSNGDPNNDKFADMADPNMDRKNPFYRHGGDLKGVENYLNYFKELGVTALWLNPVSENNQSLTDEGGQMRSAYHGYGITDFYNVDKRLGGNEAYKSLVAKAHEKGIKIIQDAVYNHVGINHWILRDLPMKSWLNQWDTYTNTSYKDQPVFDPYASKLDRNQTINGWFVPFLPDLNQKNEFVANHLIQQAIWNTETFNLDAWRIDTFFYNDLDFMNKCNAAILSNFPKIHIFGECWVNSVANQALLMENNFINPYKSNLPGNVDFQWYFGMNAGLNEKPGWNDGVQKLYQVLAQDYMYKNPEKLVLFLDNHDLDRYYSVIGEDYEKYKTGLIWLLTSRGIPQMYYGTEILMKNFKNPSDAEVRRDFPGGWADDPENKFLSQNRTSSENVAFDFIKKLANFRKSSKALTEGKLTQFLPFDDGVYAYFRTSGNQKVMVVSNTSEKAKSVATARFKEIIEGKSTLKSVLTGEDSNPSSNIELKAKETKVFEIIK